MDFVTNPLLVGLIRLETPGGSSISDGVGNTYNIEAQHTMQLGNANRMIYGVNYRLNNASNTFFSQFGVENRLGFYRHEFVVHFPHVVDEVHDDQVSEGQQEQDDPADPHEKPREEFEGASGGSGAAPV